MFADVLAHPDNARIETAAAAISDLDVMVHSSFDVEDDIKAVARKARPLKREIQEKRLGQCLDCYQGQASLSL